MTKYSTVALLPMKANSERVKGKNFKDFCGKPLFRWVLDNLLAEPRIDKIIINTDAREILKANGLEDSDKVIIRDRPEEICGDMVSMNLVIEDDVKNIDSDTYLMTHTTNPLLALKSINQALDRYEMGKQEGFDSLFTVNKIQTRFYDENVKAVNHDPDNLIRTQDLPPWYEENSCIYVFDKVSFAATNARIGEKSILFEIPKLEAIDIDEKEDWFLASVVAKGLGEENNYA